MTEDQDVEIRGIFHQLSASLVEAADSKEERVTVLQLPESELARRKVERHLAPLKPIAGRGMLVRYTTGPWRLSRWWAVLLPNQGYQE